MIQYHYPTAADMAQILSLNNFRDFGGGSVYDASFGFLDQNPHNTMHIWTGGMNPDVDPRTGEALPAYACDATPATVAAEPPMRCRARCSPPNATPRRHRWRTANSIIAEDHVSRSRSSATCSPTSPPPTTRSSGRSTSTSTALGGNGRRSNPTGLPTDLDAVLSPWSYTVRDMLDISRFGYEYVRCSYFMPVGMEAPVAAFVSKPITVDARCQEIPQGRGPPALGAAAAALVLRARLHQPAGRGCHHADMRDNPHYAGYLAIFGHGECYGGPGHCDLPPPRARAYDQRPRSHNTPRNHRVDVTKAAQARCWRKSDELQITLVVIGVDYREERDLLKLEGVSLNFLD